MRRKTSFIILMVLLVLIGLAIVLLLNWHETYPDRAVDGAVWDKEWTMLGSAMGVEAPGNGLALLDNNLALAVSDTYLATWASGDAIDYVNEDGEDMDIYEAQVYLLLLSCKDAASAQDAVDDWIAQENEQYTVTDTRTETHNGQEYTVLSYQTRSETNPYSRGAVAFSVFENYAVNAELTCLEDYSGDESAVLAAFLDGCHYNADLPQKE